MYLNDFSSKHTFLYVSDVTKHDPCLLSFVLCLYPVWIWLSYSKYFPS